MLDRYRKAGGFEQLLKLIETCGKTKQDKFLTMIEDEDPRWSRAIKQKMLTIDKIFSWNDSAIAEIVARIQELTLAIALHGLTEEKRESALSTLSHGQRRNINDLFEGKTPSSGELSAAYVKVIEEAREMIKHGYLRVAEFAPELTIEEDIEEKLANEFLDASLQASADQAQVEEAEASTPATPVGENWKGDRETMELITKKMTLLTNENRNLKKELDTVKKRLEQIKKLAA